MSPWVPSHHLTSTDDTFPNSTSDDFSLDDETDEVLTGNNIDDSVEISSDDDSSAKRNNITLFIVSDSPGTNILDAASKELFDSHNMSSVNLVIRKVNK